MDGFAGTLLIDRVAPAADHTADITDLAEVAVLRTPVDSTTNRQHTLRTPIHCRGIGLHSGREVMLRLCPAPEGSGIVFRRVDLGIDLPARYDFVIDTRLCTLLGVTDGAGKTTTVGTVEHVMAALSAAGIDNALVELDGPEVPILDGSAAPFSFLIACAGRLAQTAPRLTIEVLRTVRVSHGVAWAELRPSRTKGLHLSMEIEFTSKAIGQQAHAVTLSEASFEGELANCRTFTQTDEIERARAAGLARGGSLDNAIVVDAESVLNPGGLRRPDEFVRHKLLDAVGDLSLAGRPLRGEFVGYRSGHALNNQLLHALFADAGAWRLAGAPRRQRARREAELTVAA